MIELDVIDSDTADRDDESGPQFWRHPAERGENAADSGENPEFGPGASEPPDGASRRQFLQLMGAAMAMAGLAGCRRPEEKILPYARAPEGQMPGIPQRYATGMPFRDVLRPVLVQSHEGRPTKVEGNGEHPVGQSGTSSFEQASVLNVYDPDRSRTVRRDGSEASWDDFVSYCRGLSEQADQRTVAVLVEETSSPTVQAMRQRLDDRFSDLRWVTYAAGGDNPVRRGTEQAFGRPLRPRYNLGEAEVMLSLDSDFLDGKNRDFLHNTQAFAEGRRLESTDDEMSRLYAVESTFSTTGGTADHRLALPARRIRAAGPSHSGVRGGLGGGARSGGCARRVVERPGAGVHSRNCPRSSAGGAAGRCPGGRVAASGGACSGDGHKSATRGAGDHSDTLRRSRFGVHAG